MGISTVQQVRGAVAKEWKKIYQEKVSSVITIMTFLIFGNLLAISMLFTAKIYIGPETVFKTIAIILLVFADIFIPFMVFDWFFTGKRMAAVVYKEKYDCPLVSDYAQIISINTDDGIVQVCTGDMIVTKGNSFYTLTKVSIKGIYNVEVMGEILVYASDYSIDMVVLDNKIDNPDKIVVVGKTKF
jgi:hypothetical protein